MVVVTMMMVSMCVVMIMLGEADFKAMDVVAMPHAHERLKFVGFRNFLNGFQIRTGGFEFEKLLCSVRTERFD